MHNFELMKTAKIREQGGTTVFEFPLIEENGDESFVDVFYDADDFEWRRRISGRVIDSDDRRMIEAELARRKFERVNAEEEAELERKDRER